MPGKGVTAPKGFLAGVVSAGLKPRGRDLCVLVMQRASTAVGRFTRNRVVAGPVMWTRGLVPTERLRAVVVNAGNANCATPTALEDARAMAVRVAEGLGLEPDQVAVCSTGVIGVPLPREAVLAGIDRALESLRDDAGEEAAEAIMTTDTVPKTAQVRISLRAGEVTVGGMAKGSGMIHPNLATLLAFVTTDAAVPPAVLDRLFGEAVGETLNRVTVDGDQSTNDTALAVASGASGVAVAGREDEEALRAGLLAVLDSLARQVARDGEGASRFVEVRVTGARTVEEAARVARAVAASPLVKTAVYGADPNVGRILAAVGNAVPDLDPGQVRIWIGDVGCVAGGVVQPFDEDKARAALAGREVLLTVSLGRGDASGAAYTCDLTEGYIHINAHYRS